MKQNYDAELFLGRFDGSKQDQFSIAELFDYKSKKPSNHLKSSYFHSNDSGNMHDPIDIRGSSANWENERFTTAKR